MTEKNKKRNRDDHPNLRCLISNIILILKFKTIKIRKRLQVGVGTGDNPELLRAMRVHANFSEYVPITLLLILSVELL
ncbi:MAPEG family protein [Pseudoalteromonas sp. MTN2-4]|uniref:MAPEG family protein n=1 Tax=Pseudoalteromonas sp. MTN2-4 TaxID=3056555 RepID=UPI0036F1AE5E